MVISGMLQSDSGVRVEGAVAHVFPAGLMESLIHPKMLSEASRSICQQLPGAQSGLEEAVCVPEEQVQSPWSIRSGGRARSGANGPESSLPPHHASSFRLLCLFSGIQAKCSDCAGKFSHYSLTP